MSELAIGLICLVFALLGATLKKAYNYLPATEFKRRAESHDRLAANLYKAVSFGASLSVLLWLLTSFATAAAIILISRRLPLGTSILTAAIIIWLLYGLLPMSRVSRASLITAQLLTPIIVWLTSLLHPILSRLGRLVDDRLSAYQPTSIYEKADLLRLVNDQSRQADSRLGKEQVSLVRRALKFDELSVADVMRPRKDIKTLMTKATIGPVLINELHENHQDFALVKQSPKGDIVGSLAFSDLSLESEGKVGDVMNKRLNYLNQNDSLSEALHAFYSTNQPMLLVVNDFEEFVGIVVIKDVIEKLTGRTKPDDFDQYDSARAVAARYHQADEAAVTTETEVIE